MINRVVLIGRLTKDVELRSTQSGTAVATFTLAVNRQFTSTDGEREADFIQCVMWRKSAENFAKFTHKGSLVGIDGRVQTRNYENNQGQRVYVTEVVADNFSLLEAKSNGGNNDHRGNNAQQSAPGNSQNGRSGNNIAQKPKQNDQNSNYGADDPFRDDQEPIDISDDDLPF